MLLRASGGYRIEEPRLARKDDLWLAEGDLLVCTPRGILAEALKPPDDRRVPLLMDGSWGEIMATGKLFLPLPRELTAVEVHGGEQKAAGNFVVYRPDGYQEVRRVEIWEGLIAIGASGPRTAWDRLGE